MTSTTKNQILNQRTRGKLNKWFQIKTREAKLQLALGVLWTITEVNAFCIKSNGTALYHCCSFKTMKLLQFLGPTYGSRVWTLISLKYQYIP